MPNTFTKQERLCSETAIDQLFKNGKKKSAYPFAAVWLKRDDENAPRILISVSKKRFHTAVERNLVKRRVRAAYRTSGKFPAGYDVALVYIGTGKESVEQIQKSIQTLNNQLLTLL